MASFLTRDKNGLDLHAIDLASPQGVSQPQVVLSSPPRAASWSPDGRSVAIVDASKGVMAIQLRADVGDTEVTVFPNSSKITQMIWWSPKGTFLVTHHPIEKQEAGSDARCAPNLLVWERESAEVVASFLVPKIERGTKKSILSWTSDERLCCRVLPVGPKQFDLHILPGEDLNSEPLHVISHSTAMSCEWANLTLLEDRMLFGRLAVFCVDGRNDMKRVCSDAEVWILDVRGPDIAVSKRCETSIASGEQADLMWSPSGTALLAQVETEVDETGVSYYGSTRLVLMSPGGPEATELNKDSSGQYLPIQAVGWSPTSDNFVLIRGFQPSHVTLWKWDAEAQVVTQTQTLLEKAHRNTVKWNNVGNLVMLAGFGNLAGDMDVFGTTKDALTMAKVSVAHANCTVTADWAPDGLHILTAVLFPRMRVENGFAIYNALTGKKIAMGLRDELFEVSWRPVLAHEKYQAPSQDAIDQVAEAFAAAEPDKPKKQAYRPPKGRDGGGTNAVAAMMRGELPMERGRQKGHRQDRVQPSVRGVADEELIRRDNPVRAGNYQAEAPASKDKEEEAPKEKNNPTLTPRTGSNDRPLPPPVGPPPQPPPLPPTQKASHPAQKAPHPESATQGAGKGEKPGSAAASGEKGAVTALTRAELQDKEALKAANRHQRHGERLPCPEAGWQYVDPRGNVQGPFKLAEMQQWNKLGYFRRDLMMRCIGSDEFVKLEQLFPHPLIPFSSYPNRPLGKGNNSGSYPVLQ
eukprot:GEMP01011548.1.p1 GENE.GEMP01011548.1~~GEMP01011548.1.p1  ORF type:complete len:749 (+),score=168.62 GEMP01011548.1:120-2366(+)